MIRNLLSLVVAIPSMWLTIQVFGSIVSGDIDWTGIKLKRDNGQPTRFWTVIVGLALVCCALFGLALAVFVGAVV